MATEKDPKTGVWRFRKRMVNPFTGEHVRLTGTSKLNTKKDAERLEKIAVERLLNQDPSKPETIVSPVVKDIARLWLASLVGNPDLAESYTDKVEVNLTYHVLPEFGERRMGSITRQELEDFKIKLLNKPRALRGRAAALAKQREALQAVVREAAEVPALDVKKLQPRTVKDILRCFHGLFVYAHGRDLVPRIPRFPKPPKAGNTTPVFLDFDEEKRLYAALDNPEDQLAIMFAVRTGLRAGEQMLFEKSDIDFANAQIHVRRAFKRAKKKPQVGKPKSKHQRVVDIDAEMLSALKRGQHLRGPLMFYTADGQQMTHKYLECLIRRALAAAGITKHITWHHLRHTFGSHRAMLNSTLQQIQHWMGHSSSTTTEIYAHLLPSAGKRALEEVERNRARLAGQTE